MQIVQLESVISGVVGAEDETVMYKAVVYCNSGEWLHVVHLYCDKVGLCFDGDGALNNNYYDHQVNFRVSKNVVSSMEAEVFDDWQCLVVKKSWN